MVDISQLNEPARSAAERAASNGLTLTSGRRDIDEQAHAMAVNVNSNPQYLQIYASQAVRDCQSWVDQWLADHPGESVDIDQCRAHLLEALNGHWQDVSWHLTGDAFDCDPGGTSDQKSLLQSMVAEIESSGGDAKFLDSEHGDPAWHTQCRGGSLSSQAGSGAGATGAAAAQPAHAQPASAHAAPTGGGTPFPGTLLREGSTGNEVRTWQEQLVTLGYLQENPDGDFGRHTEAATRAFQTAKGLSVDGIVGEHTWGAAFQ